LCYRFEHTLANRRAVRYVEKSDDEDSEPSVLLGPAAEANGEESAMHKRLVGLAVVSILVSGCGGTPLKTYRSNAFGFLADLPGEPNESKALLRLYLGQSVPAKEFTVQDGDTTYLVVINRWPQSSTVSRTVIFAAMEWDVLARMASEPIEGKPIF
jgi:hypothetical protein